MTMQLLHADIVVPMDGTRRIMSDGAVVIDDAGSIVAVGDASDCCSRYPLAEVRRLHDRLLMPGLINAHAHSGLLRGTAEGLPVWEWLQVYIDPMHRVLEAADAEAASRLCYAEALLSGTTTIVDMWRFMDGSARAARDLGIRAMLVPYVAEHPDHDYFETLDTNEALIRAWHGEANGRIQVFVGLEHLFYAVPDALLRAAAMSRHYGVPLHTHSNESRFDVEATLARDGVRPIRALERYGVLDAHHVLLAHCVWLDDDEIALLAARKIGVAHNPISNMKLASGAAPVEALLTAGVAVGLGTDGEKENNNLDVFEEMKVASLLAKFVRLDASALDAWSICEMATIGGARALGIDAITGSLEPGKAADLIAVRTDTPRMTPLITGDDTNVHHNLVHAVQGGDVDLTMVAGHIVVDGGQLITGDIRAYINEVNARAPALFARRHAYLTTHPPAIRRGSELLT